MYTYIYVYVYMYMYVYLYIYIYIQVYTYVYICLYIYMHVFIYACIQYRYLYKCIVPDGGLIVFYVLLLEVSGILSRFCIQSKYSTGQILSDSILLFGLSFFT